MTGNYERVPAGFMPGLFIAPHNFSSPQNPQHGKNVNFQLRNDMYYSALHKISNIEFETDLSSDAQLKVKEMKECVGKPFWSQMWGASNLVSSSDSEREIKVLGCQDWTICKYREGKQVRESTYRVKILQSSDDLFQSEVIPKSLWGCLLHKMVN